MDFKYLHFQYEREFSNIEFWTKNYTVSRGQKNVVQILAENILQLQRNGLLCYLD